MKRRKPASVEQMEQSKWVGRETICQTLRDIYELADDERIRDKTRLAMAMAKAMNKKLRAYRNKADRRAENFRDSSGILPGF